MYTSAHLKKGKNRENYKVERQKNKLPDPQSYECGQLTMPEQRWMETKHDDRKTADLSTKQFHAITFYNYEQQ